MEQGQRALGIIPEDKLAFEYAGTQHYIPMIYRFPKGIVFDVITILDETELREFFEKYETIEEIGTITAVLYRARTSVNTFFDKLSSNILSVLCI